MSKLWLKYKNLSKLGKQNRVYRYTPNVYQYTPNVYQYTLAKNDPNTKCTGTCSKCTGTHHPEMPRMVFSPLFSICLIPKSTLYFINISRPLQIHLMISFILSSSFNYISFFKLFMNFFQNHSNMVLNPYTS